MNQQQYITAFRKALQGLDPSSREEIVREIEMHIKEMPESETLLLERFGTPAELAGRYLEGEPITVPLGKRVARVGRKFLVVTGAIGVVTVVAFAVLFHYWNRDAFDYSNANASELDSGLWDWHQVEWSSSITVHVFQSQAVFYWHGNDTLRWRCTRDRGKSAFQQGMLKIRHNECLLFLPEFLSTLVITQGDSVLVRPQADTVVELTQSRLRIAPNGNPYRFEIEAVRSSIEDFISEEDAAVTIAVKSSEAEVLGYEY